jgi:hypothetical protein
MQISVLLFISRVALVVVGRLCSEKYSRLVNELDLLMFNHLAAREVLTIAITARRSAGAVVGEPLRSISQHTTYTLAAAAPNPIAAKLYLGMGNRTNALAFACVPCRCRCTHTCVSLLDLQLCAQILD